MGRTSAGTIHGARQPVRKLLRIGVLASLLSAGALAAAEAETVLTLTPRPGATLRVLVDRPAAPVGSVILLAGNDGVLNLAANGAINSSLRDNQLVRTRAAYAAAGYTTFVPDVASDLRSTSGFRFGAAYAGDLGLVVQEARKTAGPVAAVGTSRGAISVAALMLKQSQALPDAVVISSGALLDHKGGAAATVGDVSRIRVPVLLIRHSSDSCRTTPPGDADKFKAMLTGAPKVEIVTLTGGGPQSAGADKCGAAHYHGFYGIDDKVVATTVGWLKGNMK